METQSIDGLLRSQAAERTDSDFVTVGNVTYSFGSLNRTADAVARGLSVLGVATGDRVAIICPNRPEILELMFACARLGAVQVPLNTYLRGAFLEHQLVDSGASTLVTDNEGLRAVEPLLAALSQLRRIVLIDPLSTGVSSESVEISRYGDIKVDTTPDGELLPMVTTAGHLMSILYTSGTTGMPKGCMLTHGYYLRSGTATAEALEVTESDRLVTAFQLFHASAQLMVVASALVRGVPALVLEDFRASTFLSDATAFGATVGLGVGAMGIALLSRPSDPSDLNSSLRTIMWIPFEENAQLEFEERFGIRAWAECYGQTECVPMSYHPANVSGRRASGGRAAPDIELRVVDEGDQPVSAGETGEIVIRPRAANCMFRGYWQKADATADTFRNLWHHTGDLGRLDEEDYLYFVDRKKDSIRRRGENVSAFEVETAIVRHENIMAVAAHGVPSSMSEDDVKVWLVLRPGANVSGEEELFEFFRSALPYFAVPRFVEFVDELPTNAMGRVMKDVLRERGNGDGTVDLKDLVATVSRGDRRG